MVAMVFIIYYYYFITLDLTLPDSFRDSEVAILFDAYLTSLPNGVTDICICFSNSTN